MVIGFFDIRALLTDIPGFLNRFGDSSGQNDFDFRVMRAHPVGKRKAAITGRVDQGDVNAQGCILQQCFGFHRGQRLTDPKAAFAKIFSKRVADQNIRLDQQNTGLGVVQGHSSSPR